MEKPLIILTGPTAVGKTALSVALAKAVGGEIISADSMQVYKHMDIGSAKVTEEEMDGVRHYLISEFEPDEEFHVVKFQELARRYIQEIYQRGKIPILVGGTGFYIQAVLYDIDFTETQEHSDYRRELEELERTRGAGCLHQMLSEVDRESALQIHPHNCKRVIRALEFYKMTGTKISLHNEEQKKKSSPYHFVYFVLNDDRAVLYDRINHRVDQMLANGLVEEVRKLQIRGYTKEMVSMQGLGYKEILSYLEGFCTLTEAVCLLKRDTRHFAKRQLTWFKREREVTWVPVQEFQNDRSKILEWMHWLLKEKDIVSYSEESGN